MSNTENILNNKREATLNLQIKSFGTLYYVSNIAEAVKHYQDLLGLKLREASDTWAELQIDDYNLLCLHQTKDCQKPTVDKGILIIKIKGLTEFWNSLKAKNQTVADIQEVHPGGIALDLRDQDNNIVSLYENLNHF